MNRNGHLGITLLVFAPVAYLLVTHGNPGLALVSWGGVQAVEPLPDRDFQVPGLSHRGVSHSLLAVLVVGSVLGVGGWVLGAHVFDGLLDVLPLALDALHRLIGVLPAPIAHHLDPLLTDLTPTEIVTGTRHQFGTTVNREVFAMFGFGVGVYGMLAHLLGDIITIAGISPLLPVSQRRVSLSPLRADNPAANTALFGLGMLAIVGVVVMTGPGSGLGLGFGLGSHLSAALSPVGVGAAHTTTQPATHPVATVELDNSNTTPATAVVVSEARLPDGGFVAIHHEGFSEGGVLRGSVLSVSRYLAPGIHRNVTIPVARGVPGASANVSRLHLTRGNLSAIVYRDTNHNHQFEFTASRGRTDTPYHRPSGGLITDTDSVVIESNLQRAARHSQITPGTLRFGDQQVQRVNGSPTVTAGTVTIPRGGFVAVHTARYLPPTQTPFDSVLGVSRYLAPGMHRNVTIPLSPGPAFTTQPLVAVAYLDTDGDHEYEYVTSDGEVDYGYLAHQNGRFVILHTTARVHPTRPQRATIPQPARRTAGWPSVAGATASETPPRDAVPTTVPPPLPAPPPPSRTATGTPHDRPSDTALDDPSGERHGFVGGHTLMLLLGSGLVIVVGLTFIGRLTRRA